MFIQSARSLAVRSSGALARRGPSAASVAPRFFLSSSSSSEVASEAQTKVEEPAAQTPPDVSASHVAALEAKLKESEAKYLRALAEMENVRARARKEIQTNKEFAVSHFAKDLLDVADTLAMALKSVPAEELKAEGLLKSLHEGVSMTDREMVKILGRHGIKSFESLGKPFNPEFHSALFEIEDDKLEPGTVGLVHKEGYMIHDRPLRVADVGVVRKR